ncbi:MAG: starch-binding protein [Muribaculaceae bacterium]|nr:starch-binding protein [Muribaculaceae bacterium]
MKNFKSYYLFILMLLPLLGACSKDEIIFDSELPRFETRPGYQLIEAIVPQETSANDEIYIIGHFNGGMDAVGDPRWQLQKAPDTDVKWGVYLNPDDFVEGKSLADGYTFYNVQQGEERGIGDVAVRHTDAPAIGGRLNVLIYFWEDYFRKPVNPDEVQHDGYTIYVVDNSGYDDLALYAWGDAEIFGGWPGITPTGSIQIDGINYKYFDTGAANEGLNVNLIFNDNGGGKQLADYNVTLDQDYYLELTPDGAVPFDPSAVVTHDGYTVYVYDETGWDELYLYMWGTVNDLNGAWPGMPVTGTQTINGVTYKYFDLGAANCDAGLEEHIILNNGNGKQVDDVVVFTLDRDVYVQLKASGAQEIDPATFQPSGSETPEPEPEPEPAKEYKHYIKAYPDKAELIEK